MKPLAAGPLVLALALALALAAAAPGGAMEVKTSHDAGVDFSAYRTYAWKAREGDPPNHPLAEGSPLDRAIRERVDAALKRAGLEEVEADSGVDGEPDLRLSYVAYVEDDLTIEGVREELAPGISWVGDPDAHAQIHYQHGTLVITIEDAESGEAVWSGWASDVATDVVRLGRKAEKAAARILRHFPPDER